MQTTYQIPSESCTNQERRDFWAKVVIDQKTSGLSLVKFCQLHGLKFTTFKGYLYPRRSTKIHRSTNKSDQLKSIRKTKDVAKFIPIVTNVTNKQPKNKTIDNEVKEIKFIFKNDHKLVLSPPITEAYLLSIIKIVTEL
jgi:hypothetical protein